MSKTVCFDFDGVLASYDGWRDGEIGEPLPAGIKLLKLCKEAGYNTVLSTCRTHPEHGKGAQNFNLAKIVLWLLQNDLLGLVDKVDLRGKPVADVYVDDRALFFDQSLAVDEEYAFTRFTRLQHRLGGKGDE